MQSKFLEESFWHAVRAQLAEMRRRSDELQKTLAVIPHDAGHTVLFIQKIGVQRPLLYLAQFLRLMTRGAPAH
jgi:hypothetical protein